jgi:CBS-domain-containing membrane protein
MPHRTVADLMSGYVVTVGPATPFKEIARLLSDNAISAVPVVDADGCALGVVSESDLLRKASARIDPGGRTGGPAAAEHRARAAATTAEGLMTRPAVVARPDWSVVEAARAMEANGVKRLPVVDDVGRVVGIVGRADLLRVFLRQDRAIREEITREVLDRALGVGGVVVAVEDGRVVLTGALADAARRPLLLRLCDAVDGVVSVEDRLTQAPPAGGPRRNG